MTSTRSLKLSVGAGLAGVAMLVVGLAWDARMHAADPGLAGREGVFTLSNPAHLLVALGLAGAAVGAVGAAVTVFRTGRVVAVGAVTLAAVLAAATGVWATSASDDHPHSALAASLHDETPSTTTTSMPAHGDMGMDAPTGHHHRSTPYADRVAAATPAARAAAQRILDETKATLAKYTDESAALADGFRPNPDPRSANVHYRNPANHRDGVVLDTSRPEGLVYRTRPDGSKMLLGAVYSVHPGQTVPFEAYPIVTFHSHDETGCSNFHVTPEQPCNASPRMVHVWVFNGVVDPFADSAAAAFGRTSARG